MGTNDLFACDLLASTNDSFLYATKQYAKIHFTCLIATFYMPRHAFNSLQTVTQTHYCTVRLLCV